MPESANYDRKYCERRLRTYVGGQPTLKVTSLNLITPECVAVKGEMTTYAELSRKCLDDVDALLRKHDMPQASEKLRGAFVDAIKAVAEKRALTLGTHRSIAQFVLTLEKELPGLALHNAFRHAEGLHVNFFEDHLPEESVRLSAEAVKSAIEKLRSNISF